MDGCRIASMQRLRVWVAMLLLLSGVPTYAQFPAHPFPAFFVFGDSLVDVGNNNYILSLATANYRPNGIDFPAGPTGRFTNGKTVVDVITELLQLPLLPPYLAPTTKGNNILNGVNYASGAAGILQKTGFNYIGRVDFDTQLGWFGNTISELQQLLGVSAAQNLVTNSLYTTVLGSNDYINNYLLAASNTAQQYTPAQFQQLLLTKFSSQLTQLYNMGARNIVVCNVGPLGCIPSQLAARNSQNGECVQYINNMVLSFNSGLERLVNQLNADLPGSKFIYADTFSAVFSYSSSPATYGFQFGDKGCCGLGKYNGQVPCLRYVTPCPNRDLYVFWDPFHPTQKANTLLGNFLYKTLGGKLFNSSA
eukprot:c938_g1_i1 orf=296-1387(+)